MTDGIDTYSRSTTTERQPYMKPLFYDVMSGEFTYAHDIENRTHTLGRLAYAAFIKGETSENVECVPSYLISAYSPSWARHITVEVNYDQLEGNYELIHGVWLRPSKEQSGLYLGEYSDRLHIGNSEGDKYYSLQLGKNLVVARQVVTESVQEFFDSSVIE